MDAPRVYALLERLGNLLRAEERALGKAHGLLPVQFHALAYLGRCNHYSDTPAAVAEYLGLTKGTVSQTLQVLQERGLVRAAADPADGRRVHLQPTAKGRRVLAALPPAAFAAAVAAPRLGPALTAGLERLLAELQGSRGGPTFGVCQTCRYFERDGEAFRCGLLQEPLAAEQTLRICREHAPPGP